MYVGITMGYDSCSIDEKIISLRDNLLDLSLRNPLLNFKPRKKSINIVDEDIAELYQLIVVNKEVMGFLDFSSLDEECLNDNVWDVNSKIKDSHKDNFLQTDYGINELQKRLKKLYNETKTNLEEQGYNTLYLALGFLEWNEVDYQEKMYAAPLILVPLNINRSSFASEIKVSWNFEEIKSNITLAYKLKEQSINFPTFEDLESKEDLINYLKQIEQIINVKKGWKLSKNIFISDFNFKKFVMFNDLNPDNWHNLDSSGIKQLYSVGDDEIYSDEFYSDEINDACDSQNSFNVLDADSSQLAVLEEIVKGKNLVVEGPPGTGKSQTIVNVIAELLANDKKILFVSEKKAALDVVKSRLDSINLGEGCLEIHGKNSNKKDFLEELHKTMELGSVELADKSLYCELDGIKQDLNNYVDVLHSVYGDTELSNYELMGILEFYTQYLENHGQQLIKFNLKNISKVTKEKRGKYIRNLKEISSKYELIKPIDNRPWKDTAPENISSPEVRDIEDYLNDIILNINNFSNINAKISELIGTKPLKTLNVDYLIDKCKIFRPKLKLLKKNDDLEILVDKLNQFQKKSNNINLDVLNLDLNDLENKIEILINDIDRLSINSDILAGEDFKTLSSEFKANKQQVTSSNLELALKDPNLQLKLSEFKDKKDSFLKKTFSNSFKSIKKEFKKYYDFDVSDNQIVEDLDNLIKTDNELTKLRNKISAYCVKDTNDEKIIMESEKLLSWVEDLDSIKSELSNYKINVERNMLKDKIHDLIELKDLLKYIQDNDFMGDYYFEDYWDSYKSNLDILNDILKDIVQFKKDYDSGFFTDKTMEFIDHNNFEDLDNNLNLLKNYENNVLELYENLNCKLRFKNELSFRNMHDIPFLDIKYLMEKLVEDISFLNDYRLFERNCIDYSNEYIDDLISEIKKDNVRSDSIIPLFYYNFALSALKDIFSCFNCLDEFNYKFHEEKIAQFKKLDLGVLELNRVRVRERLGDKRPNFYNQISPESNLGILQREMGKKRRIMPIRKLLSQTHDIITALKPCFMMSPMSIAQYLSPEVFENYFDYVIFDEASQVKTEDAIGAMLRGKHYVIMGDTKQLPPSAFFESDLDITEDDYIGDYTQDLESILHLCKNTFHSKMLKWHYRSKHESLIAVSNMEFYNNNLYVFPSPMKNSDDLGLKFKYDSSTVYQRGKSRTNVGEANNVVDYALDCVKKYNGSKSLGIGTFSVSQKQAILDVLELKLNENPELEQYFNESGENGFFVKNLENIQGDERDIILISMGYGKDQNGKLNLGFGPLNKEGGERRLNVLISRAKEQCVVFSNFKSSEMHTTNSSPLGVKALKTFLYFAETGEFPINYHTGEDFDSPFEESVYNFLTDEGFVVEKQVGSAGYKIDLAIVDKDDANKYILAIECDGATYHSSPMARERDRLRQQVLENLGWKFHRIWSTDWFHNRKLAKQRLVNAIKYADRNKNNMKLIKRYESSISDSNVIVKSNKDKSDEQLSIYFEQYEKYGVDDCSIYDLDMIYNLIQHESPIHINEIYNRLKKICGLKQTKKFKENVNSLVDDLVSQNKIYRKGKFFYSLSFDEDCFKARKREKPKIELISDEEIELAIKATLKIQFSSSKYDVMKFASLQFGFKSLRANVKERFEGIIDNLVLKNVIGYDGDLLKLKE